VDPEESQDGVGVHGDVGWARGRRGVPGAVEREAWCRDADEVVAEKGGFGVDDGSLNDSLQRGIRQKKSV
jgi:hypothetical protein